MFHVHNVSLFLFAHRETFALCLSRILVSSLMSLCVPMNLSVVGRRGSGGVRGGRIDLLSPRPQGLDLWARAVRAQGAAGTNCLREPRGSTGSPSLFLAVLSHQLWESRRFSFLSCMTSDPRDGPQETSGADAVRCPIRSSGRRSGSSSSAIFLAGASLLTALRRRSPSGSFSATV